MKRSKSIRALALWALLAALALSVTWPMLPRISRWGVHDWAQFYSYYGVPRRAVVEYGELPGWNPYYYGGTVQWGHPDDPTVSPLFVLILALGEVAAPKIAIILALVGGMYSMWLLARRLAVSRTASLFAAAVWGLNGWHAYHFAVGHCDHITFLFEPLALLFFLKAIDTARWAAGAGAVMALMYLSGGPYPFAFTGLLILVTSLLLSGARNSSRPLKAAVATALFAAGFAAVKLVATLQLMLLFQGSPVDVSGTTLHVLWRGLFDSSLPMSERYASLRWGAWEYAAFIGYIPAVAFLVGMVLQARRAWVWAVMGLVFLVAALGSYTPVNFFALFTILPGLSGMHVPFRFMVHFILAVAVVGAMGLDALGALIARKAGGRTAAAVASVIVFVAAANLIWMHYNRSVPIYRLASFIPPATATGTSDADVEELLLPPTKALYVAPTHARTIEVYTAFLDGRRLSWGYDAICPNEAASFPDDEDYRGEAYVAGGQGDARIAESTLSRYSVDYNAAADATLVLNQNYYPAWTAPGHSGGVINHKGLVAARVGKGSGWVVFQYAPVTRPVGGVITLLTIVTAVYVGVRRRAKPESQGEGSTTLR